MTFTECVLQCAANPEMVAQFDRLAGTNLQLRGLPIELAIDKATGKLDDDLRRFTEFVDEWVWEFMEVSK